MAAPKFHRVASGDYETADGQYNLVKLIGCNPPAWNVQYGTDWVEAQISADPEHFDYFGYADLIVDGAGSKRDAIHFFNAWYTQEKEQ